MLLGHLLRGYGIATRAKQRSRGDRVEPQGFPVVLGALGAAAMLAGEAALRCLQGSPGLLSCRCGACPLRHTRFARSVARLRSKSGACPEIQT